MKSFNLSDWALEHRSLVWYFMIVFILAGAFSYVKLGREEDPNFTIKTMVITAQWPGASAEEVTRQVTDRIEKKLQELESLDYTKSETVAGQTTVFVELLPTTKAKDVAPTWLRIRNMIADIKGDFPTGVVGPFFNDRFGDVFGNIYAFTSDGLTQRQLRDLVENARSEVLTVPNVGKVDVVGAQDEAIYLEFSTRQIAALGIDQQSVIQTLQAQNAVTQSGFVDAGPERIALRVSGQFTSEESLRSINLRVNDRFFPLTDVATIKRGYVDPPSSLFRFNGQPAIGLAIGMKQGANLLEFGEGLDAQMKRVVADLPIGVDVHRVSDQPAVVDEAVSGFTRALFEAIVIVLIISFISLGLRAGMVVAISIPLVLAITFVVMEYSGISLQRISLGALIIALGLLVDDAMIAVEMMVARLEAGDDLRKAATHVYTSTAFPMLTGTLVTVAGFIPVGLNNSAAGEFTFTLFVVIAVSLIVSWVVAVLFTPLLGVTILPKTMKSHHEKKGRFASVFSRLLGLAMRWRWVTIILTVGVFGLSIGGMGLVQQQFFPSSDRTELIIDWNLPHNSSIAETNRQMARFEKEMLADNKDIDHWTTYVGQGAPRFILSFDVQTPNVSFGQTIIVTKGLDVRDKVRTELQDYLTKTFPGTDAFVKLLDIGPPVGKPVQYRVSGPDIQKVRDLSQKFAGVIGSHPLLANMVLDWNEPSRVVKVDVLQDKARQLGVSSEDIATALNGIVEGSTATQVRDDIYLVNVIGRARASERDSIQTLQNLQLSTSNGKVVPLSAVANFRYELEQPTIWRRDRQPTITVKAAVVGPTQPATIVDQLKPKVEEFQKGLPVGYKVEVGGAVESSADSQGPIVAVAPLMLFAMATILMIQLQSFSRLFLVFAVAPTALIGVVAALLLSNAPMGFVAILGVLALIGILIRNSVILVVQIEHLRSEGMAPWQAVIEATEHRMRPIMLTAAAATLALIPISREIFWGPMAYAMMGGIVVGTALTLLFLPALYVAWFRIPRDEGVQAEAAAKA
ncbi:efflux RND transporter permease subunit [Rhizobium johnstonii]|uniref:efflux RND transporter permease subunit n=1 Tax=Rhizobium TaxID=379 RepID=UPI0003FA4AAC|nr:efflux RND transporter permease subunit [Rhizobium leguminosarum]WSH12371.1 efflux RND transporter permease subunit [Rhizobium johnstonii]MBY5322679.1 efflux RND transporter permease subunit [Rhizobium leguminosarum]MBY5384952.1 efflux RND transporter permease subunit [Rhizobium leguminosarum]MBY5390315.1 efflux RND transporter permease subunit [Rhizobium leguminosarum]MBY5420376.1 efflux RND transporter permease subunit [Rhizobium leguminosarum]